MIEKTIPADKLGKCYSFKHKIPNGGEFPMTIKATCPQAATPATTGAAAGAAATRAAAQVAIKAAEKAASSWLAVSLMSAAILLVGAGGGYAIGSGKGAGVGLLIGLICTGVLVWFMRFRKKAWAN